MAAEPADGWNAGVMYEDFMGRWSRPLAVEFVEWLAPEPGGHWLDVGTGTGALAAAICARAEPASVTGCDPSASFVDAASKAQSDPRVTFTVGGVGSLPPRAAGYDAVVSGLALNFFPDPASAVREQLRALRPGGCLGAYVWDYADGMEFLRHFWDVAGSIEPRAAALDEGVRFPICNPASLESVFVASGAERVRVDPISVPTVFRDFADYWRPFTGGTGPAPSLVATLSGEQKRELAARLRTRLGADTGGAIRLTARAWAVCGFSAV